MKILLTGATGFVGREVLRQLRATGHAVRVLVRQPNDGRARALVSEFQVETCAGNVLQAATLPAALTGMDAVIHLVGIISEVGDQTFENVHAQATQNVVNAARSTGVRRFVHMSALGTRPGAVSRYHQTKWRAEEALRTSGLDWTILRPSLIYGPEDHFVNLFARLSRYSPVVPVMGAGQTRLQPVAVEVVAACFVEALSKPTTVGQTLEICGPERLTMPELLRVLLQVTGRKRLILHLPMPLARVQAVLLEWVFSTCLGQAPPLNRDQLLMLQEDNVGDGSTATELAGRQQPNFRDGISAYLPRPTT